MACEVSAPQQARDKAAAVMVTHLCRFFGDGVTNARTHLFGYKHVRSSCPIVSTKFIYTEMSMDLTRNE